MSQPVLIAGKWRPALHETGTIQATNPSTRQPLPERYPVSDREDVLAALNAATEAAQQLRQTAPETIAAFFERYAALLEEHQETLVALAHAETGLPVEPRLRKVELPRTTNQLRQAAQVAREGSWKQPVIDTKLNIRALFAPLGKPVVIFGPNNFPYAFNGISGGDFVAALIAHNPVIAKANPGHPGTTYELAKLAFQAVQETGMPEASVQLLYHFSNEVGLELVSHPLVGAVGFTGSQAAGLALKAAADRAGIPIYLEMSGVNPVFMLPGALEERLEQIVGEFTESCTMAAGQFCTNPGLVILRAGETTERFINAVSERFASMRPGFLFSERGLTGLDATVKALVEHGAQVVTGGQPLDDEGYRYANTLLRVSGEHFLRDVEALEKEAFGPVSLFVVAEDEQQILAIARVLSGDLTGTIYSHTGDRDEALYLQLEPVLRTKVGRLLNDKMPTGVAVSSAMNHGGPYPSTGHPGFTSVGLPAAVRRFTALHSYDAVRPHRLPPELQNKNPNGRLWRLIDGEWTQQDID